jgi:MFS transporter, OFA family, oxalate/formate antiporter
MERRTCWLGIVRSERWRMAVVGVVMQATLGVVMCWSVFAGPLVAGFGWSLSQVTLTFTINYLAFGFAAFFGGLWLGRIGPRRVALVATLLYGLGTALAGLSADRLWLLYLSFGLLSGIGRGMGYIVPVAVLLKWFPDRRGLITGLTAAGYALGAVIGGPVASQVIATIGVLTTFGLLGVVSLVVLGGAALVLRPPAPGWQPPGWQPGPASDAQSDGRDYTVREAVRTGQWYVLWALIFLNGAVALGLLSQAAPMAQELTGTEALSGGTLVGAVALGSVVGRCFWPWLSDALGRRAVFAALLVCEAVGFLALPRAGTLAAFGGLAFLVVLSYGGGLGTMPAFVADYFGSEQVGPIFGLILTATGFGSVLGPLMLAASREATGSYDSALLTLGGLTLASAAIPLWLRPPGRLAGRVEAGVPVRVLST